MAAKSHEQDMIEWRRYGHWDSSAAKARFAAFALWHLWKSGAYAEFETASGHTSGDAGMGIIEAFRRESAIALELVVKAVIAKNMRDRNADPADDVVPPNHDVPMLWIEAGLAPQTGDDLYRLHLVKSTLYWSGRYATPNTAKAWKKENDAFDAVEFPNGKPSGFVARPPITFDWESFDRLYQIAHKAL